MGVNQAAVEPIRVALVEDDRYTREGLAALIAGTPGFRCVGAYGSVEEARRSISTLRPDILLLDINLPGIQGPEGVKVLKQTLASVEILMLTVYAEQDKVFESICNGACGYLLKKTPPVRLLQAIEEARQGGAPLSPEIARKVVALFQKTGPPEKLDEALTPHELRLLALLAQGHSYQSAGQELHLSVNTIRTYVRNIYDKLHVHSKSEAVTKAFRARLIS
jgi:DNA-binding NarL/FixJ family response regulator